MFKMYRIPKGDNEMTYKQYTPQELAKEVNGNQPAIKVGDHVRIRGNDEYLGKVIDEQTFRVLIILDSDGHEHGLPDDVLEISPRLTPDEAWNELPYLILPKLRDHLLRGDIILYTTDQKKIRSVCYRLLGGAGIKVTDEVKARVRKAIERIADAMGVELA